MTRTIAMIGLLALAIALPLAAAQEERPPANDTRPDDAAWVDDCPPNHMCAAGAKEEPSRGDPSGICENCRGEEQPIQYGPEGCVECTGGPVGGETCMDGQQAGEACDDDDDVVQYLGGPPADAQSESTDAKTVPALGAMGLIAAFVAAVVIVSRRF